MFIHWRVQAALNGDADSQAFFIKLGAEAEQDGDAETQAFANKVLKAAKNKQAQVIEE